MSRLRAAPPPPPIDDDEDDEPVGITKIKERFEVDDDEPSDLAVLSAEVANLALELETLGRPISTRETLPEFLRRVERVIDENTPKHVGATVNSVPADIDKAIDDAYDLGRCALLKSKKPDAVAAWVSGRRKK